MEYNPMMSLDEVNFLKKTVAGLSKGSIVLEIGTASGGSAAIMAMSNNSIKIYTIDLFSINGTDLESINVEYNKVKDTLSNFTNIEVLCGNAMTDFNDWNTDIDLYFEDGTHFDPALSINLNRWSSFVKLNGLVLLHDNTDTCPDVNKNINILVSLGKFEIMQTVDSLTLLKCKERK